MGSIVRQSSLGLIANYIGILLGFVNVMLIMPSILEAEQIGLINLILSLVMMIYPVLDFSAAQIINRYFTHTSDKQEIFNLSFLISCCGSLFFILVFYFGEPVFIKYYQKNSPEVLPYIWWIYVVSVIMSWTVLAESLSIIYGKYHVAAFFREVFFRLCILCLLIGLILHLYNFKVYSYLHFAMYGLAGVSILIYLKSKGSFRFSFVLPSFSATMKKSMFRFGAFTIFTGLASVIATRVDMIMLGSMEGLKDVGIYTIAMFMATTIEVPRKTVLQSSGPIIRIAIKQNDIDKVVQIQYKTIINLILVGGFLLTMLMSNLDSIYSLIPQGEIFRNGFLVVLFIGLSKIIEMMAGSNDEIILSSKYYAFNIVFIVLMAILSVSLNYMLIPVYGLSGAAGSSLIATVIVVLCKSWVFRILFKKSVYDFTMLSIWIFFALLGAALYFVPNFIHPVLSIFIKGVAGSLAMFVFMKWTKVSPDLNQLINQILIQVKMDHWIKM